ncbi:MerR family transcriptional regulator [Novisyntrophococcus fermenticellae]|uniref:MerR family transcriptional regulator n=1 Tax=Novisyntrophococcus fermenticellae TaxID=2068655 RepID=UPI001E44A1FE|nr:MerR family transcriptional regulator [Novisyntrophococcus fermenticellae]
MLSRDIYTMTEASGIVEERSSVLRYWEDELCLHIARNQRGHRYYTEKDIEVLFCIKELKKKGHQLKEIKEVIPMMYGDAFSKEEEERKEEFYRILDKLMQELQKKNQQEERYKRVDEAIRQHQLARRQVAATQENTKKKKQKV